MNDDLHPAEPPEPTTATSSPAPPAPAPTDAPIETLPFSLTAPAIRGAPWFETAARPIDLKHLRRSVRGVWNTLLQIFTQPLITFGALGEADSVKRAAQFYLVMDTVVSVPKALGEGAGLLWVEGLAALSKVPEVVFRTLIDEFLEHLFAGVLVMLLAIIPHLGLRLARIQNRPLRDTTRAVAYASGALLPIAALPGPAQPIWSVAVTLYTVLALKALHQVPASRVAPLAFLTLFIWFFQT